MYSRYFHAYKISLDGADRSLSRSHSCTAVHQKDSHVNSQQSEDNSWKTQTVFSLCCQLRFAAAEWVRVNAKGEKKDRKSALGSHSAGSYLSAVLLQRRSGPVSPQTGTTPEFPASLHIQHGRHVPLLPVRTFFYIYGQNWELSERTDSGAEKSSVVYKHVGRGHEVGVEVV